MCGICPRATGRRGALPVGAPIFAHEPYTCPQAGCPVSEACIMDHIRAIERTMRDKPASPGGEAYPVDRAGHTVNMTREHVESLLRQTSPRGPSYVLHFLHVSLIDVGDFKAACAHFGLTGVLADITPGEVEGEMRARRDGGDAPSTGPLPMFIDVVMGRDEADARIAIVQRRIAEARAGVPASRGNPTPASG